MRNPPEDSPSRVRENIAGLPHESDADGGSPDLSDLIRQRAEFAHDVTRIEAALARSAEGSPELYERLLRCRRISGKLENRIELVRLQQKMRVAS